MTNNGEQTTRTVRERLETVERKIDSTNAIGAAFAAMLVLLTTTLLNNAPDLITNIAVTLIILGAAADGLARAQYKWEHAKLKTWSRQAWHATKNQQPPRGTKRRDDDDDDDDDNHRDENGAARDGSDRLALPHIPLEDLAEGDYPLPASWDAAYNKQAKWPDLLMNLAFFFAVIAGIVLLIGVWWPLP